MLLTYWHVVPKVLGNAAYLLKHPGARTAYLKNLPPQVQHAPLNRPVSGITRRRVAIATQTAHGGQAVQVVALDGSHYMIKLSYTSNTIATDIAEGQNGQGGNASSQTATSLVSQQNGNYPQPIGTVRAYAMPGGRVGIIVDGSTANTDLTINPLGQPQEKGFAKSFAYGEAGRVHLLNIGQLTVTSGQIGAIEGFQDAELSGPLTIPGSTSVDRIALGAILPGGSITTGGDLQTLDVLNNVDLSGSGTGINIGRDLNLLNVGGSITLSNGANFLIGRNLGLASPAAQGDRHRIQRPVAQLHRRGQYLDGGDHPVGRQLHPEQCRDQPRQRVRDGRHDLQHDVRRGQPPGLLAALHRVRHGRTDQSAVPDAVADQRLQRERDIDRTTAHRVGPSAGGLPHGPRGRDPLSGSN